MRRRLVRLQSLDMTTNLAEENQSLSLPEDAGDPFLNNMDNRYASSDWLHVIKNIRTLLSYMRSKGRYLPSLCGRRLCTRGCKWQGTARLQP